MTETTITRLYHFEAAHWLPFVPEEHKCHRIHGHNYELAISIGSDGEVAKNGFLIDFFDLDKIVKPFIDRLDHRCLNDIEGLSNPTAEYISTWFFARVENALLTALVANPDLPNLHVAKVVVWETKDGWAETRR